MLCGLILWLTGELWGVWRNRRRHTTMQTTSEWVWLAEERWPFCRILLVLFLLVLLSHFLWRTPLLPCWLLSCA